MTAGILLLVSSRVIAQGGPPIITDDPDTPGPGYWEINIASERDADGTGRRVELPNLDINYGVGTRVQLKFEMPWLAVREPPGSRTQQGIGNANAGVKWRFLGGEGDRLAWSTYPQMEFHSSPHALDDLPGDSHPILHLPTELTLEIRRIEINGEIGRSIVSGGADRWFGGISTEVSVPGAELVAEFHDEKDRGEPSSAIVNVGARPVITKQMRGLVAIGRTLHNGRGNSPGSRVYLGLQLNLPELYESETTPGAISTSPRAK